MTLKDLYQTRTRNIEALKALANKPEGENGDLSEAQQKQFADLKAENERLETRIERQKYIDSLDRSAAGTTITGDAQLDREFSKFSIRKAVLSSIPQSGVDAGFEKEVSQELARRAGKQTAGFFVPHSVFQKRVMSDNSGSAGGYLIGNELGEYIDILRAQLISQKLGASVLNDLVGDLDIPRLGASVTAEWIADNAALTATDPSLEQLAMTPKTVGALCEFSRKMLLQASPSIEALLRNDLSSIVAKGIDGAALTGTGTNQPMGIINHSTVPTVVIGTNGGVLTYAKVLELLASIEDSNAIATGWAMSPKVAAQLRSTRLFSSSTDSAVVLDPDANSLLGFPYVATSLIPLRTKGSATNKCSSLILGNWSDLLIGYWGVLEILANPFESTAFAKGNVQVRVLQSCDVVLRHPESFARIIDAQVIE